MTAPEIEREISRLCSSILFEQDKYQRQDAAELLLDLIKELPEGAANA